MFANKSVWSPLLLTLILTACGDGDYNLGNAEGGAGTGTGTGDSGTGDSSSGNGGDSGLTETLDISALSTNVNGALDFNGSMTITATVVDTDTNAAPTTVQQVNFTSLCSGNGQASFLPASANTVAGTATAIYTATGCANSDTITATLTSNDNALQTLTFSISELVLGTTNGGTFTEGEATADIGSTALSFGGTTAIRVDVANSNATNTPAGAGIDVSFSSPCINAGTAVIDPQSKQTDVNSQVQVAYTAAGPLGNCETSDTITASQGTSNAAVTVNIAPQEFGTLEFNSANPSLLVLSGSPASTIPQRSTITFTLKDAVGAPITGRTIDFELSTTNGGINLSSDSSVTNANGEVFVDLNSGSVNTSVTVIASVTDDDGETFTTSSNPIAIGGGYPDQNSFSLSQSIRNPASWDIDGVEVDITIIASDRFQNPAPEGTQISFVADSGQIEPNCSLDSEGDCTAKWRSSDPRPVDVDNSADVDGDGTTYCDRFDGALQDPYPFPASGSRADLGDTDSDGSRGDEDFCGITNILARTIGEESFLDYNSNGLFDIAGTPDVVSTNLDEAFNNENDVFVGGVRQYDADHPEFFGDFNQNGVHDTKTDTKFRGVGCTPEAIQDGHCAELVEVREHGRICMSSSESFVSFGISNGSGGYDDLALGTTFDLTGGGSVTVRVLLFDRNGNTPSADTSIAASTENGEILLGHSAVLSNICENLPFETFFTVSPDDQSSAAKKLSFTISSADGNYEKTYTFFVED